MAQQLGCKVYALDAHFDVLSDTFGIQLYEPGPGGKYNP
jgi:hypothetical protein